MFRTGRRVLNDSGELLFGKWRGYDITELAEDDELGYLRWLVDEIEDMDDEDREVIEALLRRYGG